MTEPVPLHRVQMNALEALEHMGPVAMPALPTVIRVFREVDLLLSWRAGHTLISFSGEQPAAIAPLIGALSNTNVWIRMTAAVPLREAGVAKPEIVTAVRGCLKDPDEGVRVLASNLLQVISSTPTVDTETNP